MEIKGPNLNTYPTTSTPVSPDVNKLHQGQVIKALVIEMSSNKTLFEIIEPKLAAQFEAAGVSNLKTGQIISLKIISVGPPLSFNVLSNSNTQNKPDLMINAALRLILPKQPSMNQLLSNLEYLSNPNPKLNEIYPQQVLDLSRAAFQRLSSINDVKTASGLRSAFEKSGVFLEQQLLSSVLNRSNTVTTDTRTTLLRLAESIRSNITEPDIMLNRQVTTGDKLNSKINPDSSSEVNKNQYINKNYQHLNAKHNSLNLENLKRIASNLPPIQHSNSALHELLRNIESSLAKTQYNQLQHFIADDQTKVNWMFDVPVKQEDGTDLFYFSFTHEDTGNGSKDDNEWSVVLSFSLEKLGNINIQIYLRNNKIGATFWAKNNNTYELFNDHLTTLQLQLEKSGIKISNIRCNKGELHHSSPTENKNIFDEKV
ncbi:hypothetical protein MNBD_GAMMA22-574 [hydrothermal vent metagenome]|uniref:Flagellar hook-length control protein-like C-terminal domain-containing protein n=1 Tax=hydrothermal vent metagenome TaxID=652676 RepID=A0A3B1AGH5_9ZZZZ